MGEIRAGMRGRLRRRHFVALVVVLCGGLAALGGVALTLAEASPDSLPGNCSASPGELPDICPSLPTHNVDNGREPYLEVDVDGTRRYRFDAVLWNEGGAFELEGRDCSAVVCNEVWQWIWLGDGEPGSGESEARRIEGRLIFDVGDGHNHFHFENAARYELVVPGGENFVSRKVGFCMFDTYPDPNGSVPPRNYTGNCPRSGSTVSMGIARGWGDYYNANLTHQWIVVNGLEPGTYTLRAEVNPGREFLEANYANNVLDTPREIPGATAASLTTRTDPDTPLTIPLSGTVEGRGVPVRISGSTLNSAGSTLEFRITRQPEHGSITEIEQTGDTTAQLLYTPDPGYTGTDTFIYRTTDSRGLDSLLADVTINVAPPPPPPPPPAPAEPPAAEPATAPAPTAKPAARLLRTLIVGTAQTERINGTGAPEIINAKGGNDLIYARGGRDIVRAGKGNDRIFAGGGKDKIIAGKGNDIVRARDGKRDIINCGPGNDRVIADSQDVIKPNCEKAIVA